MGLVRYGLVSGGNGNDWNDDNRVNFNENNPENDYNNARVRPVMIVMCFLVVFHGF